ncbi:MAG: flavin reductase [Anaerolineaceae bacterium]
MPGPPRDTLLSNFWAPLCAIGSHGPLGPNAQICVSVFGASIVPDRPRLLLVLSKTNYTTALIADCKTLCVTLLTASNLDLIEPLGLRSGRDGNKLGGLAYGVTAEGDPYFPGGAGFIRCAVLDETDNGDSVSFLVAVRERQPLNDDQPITWASAQNLLSAEMLAAWAAKSANEQTIARARMLWPHEP